VTGVTPSWRVLVVDDHPVLRRGLRAMLEAEPWVTAVAEAASAAEAVTAAAEADLVVMDVGLPDGSGVDVTGCLLAAHPGLPVLVLTVDGDAATVAAALAAGARGFVLKDSEPDLVLDAVRAVRAGGLVLGPRVSAAGPAARRPPPPFDRLTERERTVLARLVAGESNARIARHLGLSEKTVRNGLSTMFVKLGVRDRVGAILLAHQAGLAPGEPPGAGDKRP
jgi:DNA-binding NarL/FixJ family response regulator